MEKIGRTDRVENGKSITKRKWTEEYSTCKKKKEG
jgi:hypothetical protein